jgi:hypothetical protein
LAYAIQTFLLPGSVRLQPYVQFSSKVKETIFYHLLLNFGKKRNKNGTWLPSGSDVQGYQYSRKRRWPSPAGAMRSSPTAARIAFAKTKHFIPLDPTATKSSSNLNTDRLKASDG